jgi:tryptophan synthase alpha chain
MGRHADGIAVGTVLVDAVAKSLVDGKATDKTVAAVRDLVADLAAGLKRSRT